MLNITKQLTKIVIIGIGHVGATCAYALQLRGLASEIVLINENPDRAQGEAMDLNHGYLFARPGRVWVGDYADCNNADIVVIAAGAHQLPGETRLDLLKRNGNILQKIIPQIVRYTRDAILIIASNPVDVLTYLAWELSGLPAEQVIGSGTILDTARFRFLLSQHFGIEPHSIHAYIIGEHGDSQVPVWSLANVAGVQLDKLDRRYGTPLSASQKDGIAKNTRCAAYEIISRKGATYYAIASGLVRIIEAIVRDESSILTVSSIIQGTHALRDICLSLPSIVNRQGNVETVELPLSNHELWKLEKSAGILRTAIDSYKSSSLQHYCLPVGMVTKSLSLELVS